MADEYATLRAAEAAAARIQAYTVPVRSGYWPLESVNDMGYWRTLEQPAKFSCHPSRYRVHPEDVA